MAQEKSETNLAELTKKYTEEMNELIKSAEELESEILTFKDVESEFNTFQNTKSGYETRLQKLNEEFFTNQKKHTEDFKKTGDSYLNNLEFRGYVTNKEKLSNKLNEVGKDIKLFEDQRRLYKVAEQAIKDIKSLKENLIAENSNLENTIKKLKKRDTVNKTTFSDEKLKNASQAVKQKHAEMQEQRKLLEKELKKFEKNQEKKETAHSATKIFGNDENNDKKRVTSKQILEILGSDYSRFKDEKDNFIFESKNEKRMISVTKDNISNKGKLIDEAHLNKMVKIAELKFPNQKLIFFSENKEELEIMKAYAKKNPDRYFVAETKKEQEKLKKQFAEENKKEAPETKPGPEPGSKENKKEEEPKNRNRSNANPPKFQKTEEQENQNTFKH